MLKPYISNYLEKTNLSNAIFPSKSGDTILTKTLESSDPDEIDMKSDSTRLTDTVESSDPDEICLYASTIKTATLEESDPDAMDL